MIAVCVDDDIVALNLEVQDLYSGGCRVQRLIIALHQDDQGDWVVDLECGHAQHVRHQPPWVERLWVTTPDGRQNRLGSPVDCRQCDVQADGEED
jgi:Protein of unknown function (DUF3565)